jgi:hypothetical protein
LGEPKNNLTPSLRTLTGAERSNNCHSHLPLEVLLWGGMQLILTIYDIIIASSATSVRCNINGLSEVSESESNKGTNASEAQMERLYPLCAILFLTTSGIFDKLQILQGPAISAVVRPNTKGFQPAIASAMPAENGARSRTCEIEMRQAFLRDRIPAHAARLQTPIRGRKCLCNSRRWAHSVETRTLRQTKNELAAAPAS